MMNHPLVNDQQANKNTSIYPDLYQKLRLDSFRERLKKREIWLNGPIDSSLIELLYMNLVDLDIKSGELPITVVINSTGGLLYESMVATDIMGTIRVPVRTIALANAVSGGFILFMGGKQRVCHDYTNLMMHCAGFRTAGKVSGVKKGAEYVLYSMKKLAKLFSNQTEGKTTEKFWMDIFENEADRWFEVEEAIELGIVHKVVRRSEFVPKEPRKPYTWNIVTNAKNSRFQS